MKQAIQKLISVAEAELGYLEKATNNQLNDKTANAGQNNYTKYGSYWGDVNGYWCDYFVDWCFVQAFGKDKAKSLLHGFSGYTPTSAQYFKNNGQWSHTPQVGAVVFFRNSERICHTGIVVAVTDGTIQTIEGNTSGGSSLVPNGGCVARKTYYRNYDRIDGYGMPDYPEDEPMYKTFIEAVEGTAKKARNEGWKYGDSHSAKPCDDGIISCDRLVARALYDLDPKYRDQQNGGITTYTIEQYLLNHGWYKNTNINKIKSGDIVFMQKNGTASADWQWHVFVCKAFRSANDIDKYDAGSQSRINVGCFFGSVPVNEWSDRNFYCSFTQTKPSKPLPGNWNQIVGYDRYETAAILAKKAFDHPKNIVLVSGENFPDALCAFGYAGLINAPVVFTQNMQLSTATYYLLKEWGSVKGCAVVGKAIKGDALGKLFGLGIDTVTVCGGSNRQETAEMVAKNVVSDTIVVCSGDSFADAASIAPWLYKKKWPVLLAHEGKLTEQSKKLLEKYDTIYVIGGEKAVNDSEINKPYRRLGGNDRYETSFKVVQHFASDYSDLYCVSGDDRCFADALACGCLGNPVILAEGNLDFIKEVRPAHGHVVGGLDKDIIADIL